jgi:hypothetical protein
MIVHGRVKSHANNICFIVCTWRSLIPHVATADHATPDDKTCVVLTGNHANVDNQIVAAATSSEVNHCAYVILCFHIFSPIVFAILSHPIIDHIHNTVAIVAITQNGTRHTKNAIGKNVTSTVIITHTPFCQSFDP